MARLTLEDVILVMRRLAEAGQAEVSSTQVVEATKGSSATVRRHLDRLYASGKVSRTGRARATRYRLREPVTPAAGTPVAPAFRLHAEWSAASRSLADKLDVPLAAREPVTYQREFVDRYVPNETWLVPVTLAEELYRAGRMQGQLPAGTYARKVLEQLLIDLSWSSSRLEGNRYSLLATEELFKSGMAGGDIDAVMLLNHKAAIEFLVDAVPAQGMTMGLVRNLHAVLMQDLLADIDGLGAIRRKVVHIRDTHYVPMQVPALLEEMLESILAKARLIKNPVEGAFFLWVNLAYLQPFEDGNKRTSRLAANIPLMLYNCAPLSFLDVGPQDYAHAMLGVYEFRDVSLAVDLFAWTYRRSMKKYVVVMESMGAPDPLRLRYRESLNDAIGLVVRERKPAQAAMRELGLTAEAAPGFQALLSEELRKLEVFNCARYRLTMSATEAWIAAGRPQ
jgi:Fic family protein